MNTYDLEYFRSIPGYEGLYEAGSLGNIKSLPRNGTLGGILKPETNKQGYKRVVLSKNDTTRKFFVHRLIALALIPNPKKLPKIHHISAQTGDNKVFNLKWCTDSQNRKFSFEMGHITFKTLREMRVNQMRSVKQFDKRGNLIAEFRSISEAAETLNRTPEAIQACLVGRSRTCAGFLWK